MKVWTPTEYEQFVKGQETICASMLPDFPPVGDKLREEQRVDYDIMFRSDSSIADLEISVDAALKKFQVWLLDNYVRPGMAQQEYLSVQVERVIGGEKITFGMGASFVVNSGAGRSANYDRLLDAIDIQFKRYERDRARVAAPAAAGEGGESISGSVVEVPAARLEVSVKGGKRLFNVMCGEWQKHGVPFYDEAIKAAGVDPTTIPDSGWDLSKYRAVVQMNGTTPKRVLRLLKNSG